MILRAAIVLLATSSFCAASVTTVTIFSPANNRNTSFQIYLPPNYASNVATRFPVVYSLHGIGGTSSQRATTAAPTLDSLINSNQAPPMIWVFPDGQTDSFWGDAFDGHKQVYANVIQEILPYVDANFRSIAHRNGRALEGFSMGGFGAAMYAAKHPELFSAVVESGGALSKWQDLVNFNHAVADEMYDLSEANFLPYSLWTLTGNNAETIRTSVNYKMIVGDADPQEASNERFRDYLISLNIDPHYQVLPGVAHMGGTYFAEGSGVRFLGDHFNSIPEPGACGFGMVALLFAARRAR